MPEVTDSAMALLKPNLWLVWTNIALRGEARSIEADREGRSTESPIELLRLQTEECIVAVVAIRHAMLQLHLEWVPYIQVPGNKPERKVPRLATTDLPTTDQDIRTWMQSFGQVVTERNDIIHDPGEFAPPTAHPLGINTSQLDATFPAQRATFVVDLFLDFLERVWTAPAARLAKWVETHHNVLPMLLETRHRYRLPEVGPLMGR